MKKVSKILAGLISTVTIFSSLLILNTKLNKEVKYDDFHESVETLDSIFEGDSRPHKLEPKKAYEGDSLLEPIVKVQISDLSAEGKRSIRFVAAIPDLNLSAKFVRTMYDEEGVAFKETKEYQVSEAYTSIIAGNSKVYPSAFGEGYHYFVTYTMSNVPNDYWYHALDVDLVLEARNEDNQLLESNGSNEANVEGLMTDYYESTYNYTELEDGTYEVSVKEEKKKDKNQKRYELGNHKNERDEHKPNVAKRGKEVTSIAENGFSDCEYMTDLILPKYLKRIKNYAFNLCSNLKGVFFRGELYKWLEITFENEKSNPLVYSGSLYDKNYKEVTDVFVPKEITEINDFAFYNSKTLKSVTFEKGSQCVRIGEYSFGHCDNLEKINLPASLTTIGSYAFTNCKSLLNIVIQSNVREIKTRAFYMCENLEKVEILDGITKFNEQIFSGCSKLKEVILPSTLLEISTKCFYECIGLEKIEIPEGVKTIWTDAFKNCTSLKEVVLPSTLARIENSVFVNCPLLKSVYISDMYSWLNIWFYGHDSNPLINGGHLYLNNEIVTRVIVPEGISKLRDYVFNNCQSIVDIYLPSTITSIGRNTLDYCINLENIYVNENNQYYKSIDGILYNSDNTKLLKYPEGKKDLIYEIKEGTQIISPSALRNCKYIKEIILPSSLEQIEEFAFGDCLNLTKVILNEGLTVFGNRAFENCGNLLSINLPDTIINIGFYVFSGCKNMVEISLSNGIESISWGMFSNCSSLKEIVIPESVNSISSNAFEYCESLTTIIIPKGVTYIGSNAFSNCSSLESIEIPEEVTNIKTYTFNNCFSLKEIEFSGNVTLIESYAFSGCLSLIYLNLPSGITNINSYTFSGCSGLTYVYIPESVKTISSQAFFECNSLLSLVIPNSVTSIGLGALKKCDGLKSIVLPFLGSSVSDTNNFNLGYIFGGSRSPYNPSYEYNKEFVPSSLQKVTITNSRIIGYGAFKNCENIKNVEILDGVTSIDNEAFYNCKNLVSVKLPSTLTSMNHYAFFNCGNLTRISIPLSVKKIGYIAFAACPKLSIYCEAESQPTGWHSEWKENSISVYYNHVINYYSEGIEYIIINGEASVYSYNGEDNYVLIPEIINMDGNEYIVSSISESAFSKCVDIVSITLPSSIKYIENNVFRDCLNLRKINLSQNIESINYEAFYNCTSLEKIVLNVNVVNIGQQVFENCLNLSIYCEVESQPEGWDSSWNSSNCPVYYLGEWEYVNGVPAVI